MTEVEIINLKLDEDYTLDLLGMGTVGYSWIYNIDKKTIVKISHQYIVPPNPKPGDSGIERFTISGIRRGSCIIEFRQIQSWEKDKLPFSVKKFQVNVK
jgi:predicted secreted protein